MKSNKIKISVIVAVYNAEKYLRQCLDSLANQTLKDIEIVCVNDGSTDNSLEILNEYASKDQRFIIINQENKGPGGARNKALDYATGEFICITDSDDYRSLDCLEKLYNAAKKFGADSAFGDIQHIENNGRYNRIDLYPKPYDCLLSSDLYFEKSLYQCQFIFKRDLIGDIRTVENVDYEDGIYLYKIFMKINTSVHVKDALYYYRKQFFSSSGGKTYKVLRIHETLQYFYQLLPDYKKHDKYHILESKYYFYIDFLLGKFYKRMPDDVKIRDICSSFMKLLPFIFSYRKIKEIIRFILFIIRRILSPVTNKIFYKDKRCYYSFFVFFNTFIVKKMRKKGKKIKEKIRNNKRNLK